MYDIMRNYVCMHVIRYVCMYVCMYARPIANQFPGHRCIDDLTTERSFESRTTWGTDVLGLDFWQVIHNCVCNQTLASDRSTGASGGLGHELNAFTVDAWSDFLAFPHHLALSAFFCGIDLPSEVIDRILEINIIAIPHRRTLQLADQCLL